MSADEKKEFKHPGPILKAARDELRLSVNEVAEKLHLRSSVVSLIESETYDDFASDVFLKGYFRSYCRLVGLHEARMVELLENQLVEIQQAKEMAEKEELDAASRAKRMRFLKHVGIASAIVIVCAFTIWLLMGAQGFGSSEAADASEAEAISSAVRQTTNEILADAEISSAQDTAELGDVRIESPDEQAVSDEGPIIVAEEKPLAADLISGERNDSESSGLDSESAVMTDPETNVLNEPSSGGSFKQVDVVFSEECWFEAYAANGQRITAALKRAGSSFSHNGQTPLRLVFGKGSAASLSVNGEAYDFSDRIRRSGRAEITIE